MKEEMTESFRERTLRLLESRFYKAREPYVNKYETVKKEYGTLVAKVITAFKEEAKKHEQTFILTVDEYGEIEAKSRIDIGSSGFDYDCNTPKSFMSLPAVKRSCEKLKAERDRDDPQLKNLADMLDTIRRHLTCYEADSPTLRREIKRFNEEIKKLEIASD